MPSFATRRIFGKYITPYDIELATSFVKGLIATAHGGSGIISLIRIDTENEAQYISDDKKLAFCFEGDAVHSLGKAGMPVDDFIKLFARRMKITADSENLVHLNIRGKAEINEETKVVTLGEPIAERIWMMEEFAGADVAISKGAVRLPPGARFDGDNFVFDNDDNLVDSIHLPHNHNVNFIMSISEYSYEGFHSLTAVWNNPEKPFFQEMHFGKEGKVSEYTFDSMTPDAIEYEIFTENLDVKLSKNEPFHLFLESIAKDNLLEEDELEEKKSSQKSEIRGWEITGEDIRSLNEVELQFLVENDYKEVYTEANFIYCDSWDYPVTSSSVMTPII